MLKNNYFKFIFLIFISSFFHYSSILALIFIPLYRYREFLYKKSYIFLFSSFAFCFVFFEIVLSFFDKYAYYLNGDDITNKVSWLLFLFHFSLYLVLNYFLRVEKKLPEYMKFIVCVNSLYIGFLIFYQFYNISNQGVYRSLYYFLWASNISFLFILKQLNLDLRFFLNLLIFLVLVSYLAYLIMYSGQGFYPYRFNEYLRFL